ANGDAGKDAVRKLAGEQERLAERAKKLEEQLNSAAAGRQPAGNQQSINTQQSTLSNRAAASAASDAAKELDRQKLSERRQQTADAMRSATEEPKGGRGNTASRSTDDPRAQAGTQQELARALDRVADRMAAGVGARDGESQKLSDQRARAQELRDQLNATAQ